MALRINGEEVDPNTWKPFKGPSTESAGASIESSSYGPPSRSVVIKSKPVKTKPVKTKPVKTKPVKTKPISSTKAALPDPKSKPVASTLSAGADTNSELVPRTKSTGVRFKLPKPKPKPVPLATSAVIKPKPVHPAVIRLRPLHLTRSAAKKLRDASLTRSTVIKPEPVPSPKWIPHGAPERHYVENIHLPVLIYRACLPPDAGPGDVVNFLLPHRWQVDPTRQNDTPKHKSHQCLAIYSGHVRLQLGKGFINLKPIVDLFARDLIVLPCGVVYYVVEGECQLVFYPKNKHDRFGGPSHQLGQAKLPDCDPVFGEDGPLVNVWKEADVAWLKMVNI